MNGRYVLDTNIVIALIDEEPSVLARMAVADETLIPIVVLGALTRQYEPAVATRDQHFDAAEHLEVVRW